jgi:hypothetical protein
MSLLGAFSFVLVIGFVSSVEDHSFDEFAAEEVLFFFCFFLDEMR